MLQLLSRAALAACAVICAPIAIAQTYNSVAIGINRETNPPTVGLKDGTAWKPAGVLSASGGMLPTFACASSRWVNSASLGEAVCAQPAFSDIAGLLGSDRVTFTASGASAIPVTVASVITVRTPEQYHASGDDSTTITCATTAGSASVPCSGGIGNFAVGQGIRLSGAGPAYAGSAPSGLTVGVVGTTGSTTRYYTVRPIFQNGSVGPALALVSNGGTGHAAPDFYNYDDISWTASSGSPKGYLVMMSTTNDLSNATRIGVVPPDQLWFRYVGRVETNTSDYLPANGASANVNEYLVATITGISGTTLTVSPVPSTTNGTSTGRHDDTQAIKDAISNCSAQCRVEANGVYPVSSEIAMSNAGTFAGLGATGASTSASRIVWKGTPEGSVFYLGGVGGSLVEGGTIRDIEIRGEGMAAYALTVKDTSYCLVDNVALKGALTAALFRTNMAAPSAAQKSRQCRFARPFIPLRDNNMFWADGVRIDGLDNGLTLDLFDRPRISHMYGHGFHWVGGTGHGAGDGFEIHYPFTFRATGEGGTDGGYGIKVATSDPTMITGALSVHPYAILNGGVYWEQPGRIELSHIIGFDSRNVAEIGYAARPFMGPGAVDFSGGTHNGTMWGDARFPCGYGDVCGSSNMTVSWLNTTASPGVLHTETMNFLTLRNGSATIQDSATLEGSEITTQASTNDITGVYIPRGLFGPSATSSPRLMLSTNFTETANVKLRLGFMTGLTDPPTNAAMIEYDPDVNANFRCVAKTGASQTEAVSIFNPTTHPNLRWRITLDQSRLVVMAYLGNSGANGQNTADLWFHACTVTTNVPTGRMRMVASIQTKTTAAKKFTLRGWAHAHRFPGW